MWSYHENPGCLHWFQRSTLKWWNVYPFPHIDWTNCSSRELRKSSCVHYSLSGPPRLSYRLWYDYFFGFIRSPSEVRLAHHAARVCSCNKGRKTINNTFAPMTMKLLILTVLHFIPHYVVHAVLLLYETRDIFPGSTTWAARFIHVLCSCCCWLRQRI